MWASKPFYNILENVRGLQGAYGYNFVAHGEGFGTGTSETTATTPDRPQEEGTTTPAQQAETRETAQPRSPRREDSCDDNSDCPSGQACYGIEADLVSRYCLPL